MTTEQVEVTIGAEGGKKIFDSFKELADWFENEKTFWLWINTPPWQGEAHSRCSNIFNGFFVNLSNVFANTKTLPDNQRDGGLNNIKNVFKDFYEAKRGIYSGTSKAKFLDRHRQKEMAVACYACAFFMRQDMNYVAPDAVRGALLAVAFDFGMTERAVDETTALQELRKNWDDMAQGFKNSLNDETQGSSFLATAGLKDAIPLGLFEIVKNHYIFYFQESMPRYARTVPSAPTELGEGPRGVGGYRHGAPTELFKIQMLPDRWFIFSLSGSLPVALKLSWH
jgi:hypothetical protein